MVCVCDMTLFVSRRRRRGFPAPLRNQMHFTNANCSGASRVFRPRLPHCRGFKTIEFSRGEDVAQNLSGMGEPTSSQAVASVAFEYISSVCILIIWNSHRDFHFCLSRHAGTIPCVFLICCHSRFYRAVMNKQHTWNINVYFWSCKWPTSQQNIGNYRSLRDRHQSRWRAMFLV